MTTKREAYKMGIETGYDIVDSNIADLSPDSTQGDIDKLIEECAEWESDGYRQFTPFEFVAHDFNSSRYPDETWQAYDDGVTKGMDKRIAEWKRDNNWTNKERVE